MAKQKKSVRTVITVILLFAIIAMIIFLTTYIKLNSRVKPNPPGTTGNTGGNINNEGLAKSFCHELMHSMEQNSDASEFFPDWNKYNPKGYKYT